jgi:nicotinate-nucleotide pyrophosphorylase (carboxylating)
MEKLIPLIRRALDEDMPRTDCTQDCLGSPSDVYTARLITKENGVFYGVDIISTCCTILSPRIEPTIPFTDGQCMTAGDTIATLLGPADTILKIERTLLNFLQRLSGIATLTQQVVAVLDNPKIEVVDTRKTTPGLRLLEKRAVVAGGGYNHRFSLSDMVLIKENHLSRFLMSNEARLLGKKIKNYKRNYPTIKIEIEIESIDQLSQFDLSDVDYIMLDNFSYEAIQAAAVLIRRSYPTAKIEVSGNITLDTIASYRSLDIDRISMGCLTHSVKALDLSLLL